jgi:DNA-binding ferritin-like protein
MSIRRNTDEKYRAFWQQVDESAERVAQWPSWMIDRPPQWSVDSTTDDNIEPGQEALSAPVNHC